MKALSRIPRTGLWVGACVAALDAMAAHQGFANSTSTQTTVVVTEATNSAATISPNRRTIIMDVQGVLWSFASSGRQRNAADRSPARGGSARLLAAR